MGDLDEVLNKLQKKYGPSLVVSANDIKTVECERASTGSFALDLELGGGLPFGRIIEFFGKESSGKTTTALKVVASVQKMKKRAVWIDVEHSFDPRWAKLMEVDIEKLTLSQPRTGEEALEVLEAVLGSGECGIVVLDSIAALQPSADLEKSMDESERIGSRATMLTRSMSRLLSALNSYDEEGAFNNCMVLLINQIRYKIGMMFGNPETTPGGMAVRHAEHVRIKLVHGKWVEKENEITGEKDKIGHTIRFRTEKNKTYIPFREGEFTLFFAGEFKGQVDQVDEVVRYGQLYRVVDLTGRTFTYENIKAVGKDKFVELLRSEPKLVDKIKKDILKIATKT
jgi:recombination protein RecA